MSRPTHVVVFGVDDEGKQADWLMPLEEFAKLFTYGQTLHHESGELAGMTQDIWLKPGPTQVQRNKQEGLGK